eukprot:2345396-Pleurochrysis_carterae.AAC.1
MHLIVGDCGATAHRRLHDHSSLDCISQLSRAHSAPPCRLHDDGQSAHLGNLAPKGIAPNRRLQLFKRLPETCPTATMAHPPRARFNQRGRILRQSYACTCRARPRRRLHCRCRRHRFRKGSACKRPARSRLECAARAQTPCEARRRRLPHARLGRCRRGDELRKTCAAAMRAPGCSNLRDRLPYAHK